MTCHRRREAASVAVGFVLGSRRTRDDRPDRFAPLVVRRSERRLGTKLTLSEYKLPERTTHIALGCLDVIAGFEATMDLLDRNPRDLRKRSFGELYRSGYGPNDLLIATLVRHCHCLCSDDTLSKSVIALVASHRNLQPSTIGREAPNRWM